MRLWHFTSTHHLPRIMESGQLTVTESNIGAPDALPAAFPGQVFRSVGEHVGPDVVWMFNTPEPVMPEDGAMLRSVVDKRLVRIEVVVPDGDAVWWPVFAKGQGIDRVWYDRLAAAGRPSQWVVVPRVVCRCEWVRVQVRESVDSPWKVVDMPPVLV